MNELVNEYRNEKILFYQLLTCLYISNSINWTQESCCFANHYSISSYLVKLDQTPSFENHIDILASYPFSKIELEHECDFDLQVCNSISFLNAILTPVSLPDFNPFPESVLDPLPVNREIESPILLDQHIKLDQYHTFESPLTNWQVFIFMKLNSKRNLTPVLNYVIQLKFLNQY